MIDPEKLAGLVKPLVWEYHPMGFIAAPPTGQAYIIDIRIKGRVMFIKGINPPPQCSSVNEAKAAAQADYAARIAAALDPAAVEAMLAEAEARGIRRAADRTLGFATGHECRQAILAMLDAYAEENDVDR